MTNTFWNRPMPDPGRPFPACPESTPCACAALRRTLFPPSHNPLYATCTPRNSDTSNVITWLFATQSGMVALTSIHVDLQLTALCANDVWATMRSEDRTTSSLRDFSSKLWERATGHGVVVMELLLRCPLWSHRAVSRANTSPTPPSNSTPPWKRLSLSSRGSCLLLDL